jgi:hypothetical protein
LLRSLPHSKSNMTSFITNNNNKNNNINNNNINSIAPASGRNSDRPCSARSGNGGGELRQRSSRQ